MRFAVTTGVQAGAAHRKCLLGFPACPRLSSGDTLPPAWICKLRSHCTGRVRSTTQHLKIGSRSGAPGQPLPRRRQQATRSLVQPVGACLRVLDPPRDLAAKGIHCHHVTQQQRNHRQHLPGQASRERAERR
ncbi:hypothetical protein ABPG77_005286 [Micractinium sp. CCAP 211/92]